MAQTTKMTVLLQRTGLTITRMKNGNVNIVQNSNAAKDTQQVVIIQADDWRMAVAMDGIL